VALGEAGTGRVRRLGSRHDVVSVYTLSPPGSTERLLHIEARLREKLCVAQQAVGVVGRILPSPFGAPIEAPARGAAEELGDIRAALRTWLSRGESPPEHQPIVAAVVAAVRGFVAAVDEGGTTLLVADVGGGIETTPEVIRRALTDAGGDAGALDPTIASRAKHRVEQWLADRRAAASIDLHAALTARSRRAVLNRVTTALARAPRHRRAALAPLAAAARSVVTAPLPEGAERVLDTLVHAELPDEAWLRSVAAFGRLNVKPRPDADRRESRVLALIVFAGSE